MTNNTLDNGVLEPGDTAEHGVPSNVLAQGVAVKALSTNASNVLIGKKGSPTFPLAPGESISLDLKGAGLFYKLVTGTDKLAWITVAS